MPARANERNAVHRSMPVFSLFHTHSNRPRTPQIADQQRTSWFVFTCVCDLTPVALTASGVACWSKIKQCRTIGLVTRGDAILFLDCVASLHRCLWGCMSACQCYGPNPVSETFLRFNVVEDVAAAVAVVVVLVLVVRVATAVVFNLARFPLCFVLHC